MAERELSWRKLLAPAVLAGVVTALLGPGRLAVLALGGVWLAAQDLADRRHGADTESRPLAWLGLLGALGLLPWVAPAWLVAVAAGALGLGLLARGVERASGAGRNGVLAALVAACGGGWLGWLLPAGWLRPLPATAGDALLLGGVAALLAGRAAAGRNRSAALLGAGREVGGLVLWLAATVPLLVPGATWLPRLAAGLLSAGLLLVVTGAEAEPGSSRWALRRPLLVAAIVFEQLPRIVSLARAWFDRLIEWIVSVRAEALLVVAGVVLAALAVGLGLAFLSEHLWQGRFLNGLARSAGELLCGLDSAGRVQGAARRGAESLARAVPERARRAWWLARLGLAGALGGVQAAGEEPERRPSRLALLRRARVEAAGAALENALRDAREAEAEGELGPAAGALWTVIERYLSGLAALLEAHVAGAAGAERPDPRNPTALAVLVEAAARLDALEAVVAWASRRDPDERRAAPLAVRVHALQSRVRAIRGVSCPPAGADREELCEWVAATPEPVGPTPALPLRPREWVVRAWLCRAVLAGNLPAAMDARVELKEMGFELAPEHLEWLGDAGWPEPAEDSELVDWTRLTAAADLHEAGAGTRIRVLRRRDGRHGRRGAGHG